MESAEARALKLLTRPFVPEGHWLYCERGENDEPLESPILMKLFDTESLMSEGVLKAVNKNSGELGRLWTIRTSVTDEIMSMIGDDVFPPDAAIGTVDTTELSGGRPSLSLVIEFVPVSSAIKFQEKFHEYGMKVIGIPEQDKQR